MSSMGRAGADIVVAATGSLGADGVGAAIASLGAASRVAVVASLGAAGGAEALGSRMALRAISAGALARSLPGSMRVLLDSGMVGSGCNPIPAWIR
jgi:carbon monoxide dehydrogenase subunit G